MPFDPNLPFEEVDETDTLSFDTVSKPKATGFDFNQPFEEVETTEDQTQFDADYFTPKPLKTEKEKREIGTIEGISNAAKNAFDSSRQAMDVVGGVTPEEAQNISKIEFDKKARKLAPGYDEYQKAEGWDAAFAFAKNPIEVTSNIIAEGLAGSLPALGAGLAAGGVGAAAGSVVPVLGTGAGFLAGQVAGTFAGSLATEYGGKVLEELQGEGMDISDPNSIQTFFGNEELVGKARDKALTRGVPVAAFDALSAGIGGKLGRVFGTKVITEGEKIIGKQFATKTGEALTELGVQAGLGAGGEVAGALAIGEPIEGKAVFGEAIGEVGTGGIQVLTGRIADKRAMAKAQEDAKIKVASELSTTLEENSSPLTAKVVTAKTATSIEQDKLAAQLDEELSAQQPVTPVTQPPTIDATQEIIQQQGVRQEPQDGTQIGATPEASISDSVLGAEGIQEEGQVDSTIFDLQSVANNTATREQISSLSLSGLVDIRKGQAIINEDGEGILAQAQAPLPKLTPEARATEVEAATPRPLSTDFLPTETPGAEYGREAELFDVFGGIRRRPVDVTEPIIGEEPQVSPIVGEQVTETTPVEQVAETKISEEPIISEKPQTSEIVGAETPAIVEQEQAAPAVSQEFKDELEMSGVAYDGDTRYSVQQSSDGTFRAERIANGSREDIAIGLPDIETAQGVILNSVGKETPAITAETPTTITPETPQQVPSGMSVEEAEAYLDERNKSTIFGYAPEDIMAMQQGKRVARTIPPALVTEQAAPEPTEIETDPVRIQEIKSSIQEGNLILRTGKFNGKKLSPEKLASVQRSVTSSLAKLGETPAVTEAPAPEVASASFGQRMLDSINEKLAQGKDVFISTMTKSTKVNKKAVDNWNKAGKPLFKVGKDGNLYIGSGKRYDQLTSADMALVGFSSEGKKLVVAPAVTPAPVTEQASPAEAPAPEVAPAMPKEISDLYLEASGLRFTLNALQMQMGEKRLSGKSKAEFDNTKAKLDNIELKLSEYEKSKKDQLPSIPAKPKKEITQLFQDGETVEYYDDLFDKTQKVKILYKTGDGDNGTERYQIQFEDGKEASIWSNELKPITTPAVSETITEPAAAPSPKTLAPIESQTTTNLRNKIKEARGSDRKIVVMQAIAEGVFFPSAIEAAEFGKPFPSIDKTLSSNLPDELKGRIDTSKIKLSVIKSKSPEEAASKLISNDDERWILGGVYFDSTNNVVVATDGRALVAIPKKITGGDKVVAARNIKKTTYQEEIKKGQLIDGNYPNWKQVIPTYGNAVEKVDIDIDDALKSATILDSLNNTFNNKNEKSVINFKDARFDPVYILSSITTLVESGAKSITAQIKSKEDPLLLTGDNGAIAVIMPTKLNVAILHPLKARSAKQKLGEKRAMKMVDGAIANQEAVTPIPEANRYTYEEAVRLVDSYFDKEGIPEGVVIVNNTTDKDLEMKAGYFVNRGQIVINLAYIAKGENLSDIISHELGHYIFGDPQFQADFKSFWEAMTPEEQAEADRLINQFYNKETGAVQMEEKQVRAFLQLIQDSKAMPKWKQLLDSIKRWINEKLGTNFQVTDRGALSVLAAAHKRFKSGERIIREIDSGVLKMAAEPKREKVAGKERGDIITTPEGIIKQTQEVLRNKFFDGTEVSDNATQQAWNYIEQLLDIKSGAANALAGQINDVVDQETNSDSRMGASLFSVSLANYAAKLAAQGDMTMLPYIIRRINRMPVDNLAGGTSDSARALRARREYDIDGYTAIETDRESKIERTAATLFGTSKPSKEQVKVVKDAIDSADEESIGTPEDVAAEIEKVEKRTGRKVIKAIDDKIKESTEPKKEELLISFENLDADRKIKGITIKYNPQKVNPAKNIKDFIIGKMVDYRKTLVNQGAGGLESTFWQTMSDQENKPGPLGELDQAQNNELAKIVKDTLIKLKLKGEPQNTKMTEIEKVASILNENKLSDEKRLEADSRIVEEIERRRQGELASGSSPEAVNAKYDVILDAWNEAMSRQINMPISDNMLQRLLKSEIKERNTKTSELINEEDGRVVEEVKNDIVDSIIRRIYGVSKESEIGIEMDEDYTNLQSYLKQTLNNMYATAIDKKNAAYAKRQAQISLRSNVEGQAQSIINQLADQMTDTPAFPQKQENQVKTIVQQDLRQNPNMGRKQPWTSQLTAKLIQAGVSETQAQKISDLVWRQHEIKAMDRELKELQTAAEKGSLAVIIQRIKDTPLAMQQEPNWMQGVIREYLVEAGLSEKAAGTAAKLYESVISERFAEAKQKAFEAALNKSAPWNNFLSRNVKLGKDALKKIQEAIRTGVLDPTQTTESIIAKQNGWSGFSKEQLTRIVQLDDILSDSNTNQVTKAEAMSELNKIIVKAKMPVRFKDAISSFYVAQALSGIPTFIVNIASPTFFAIRNLAIDVAKYAVTDPKNIPVAFQSFINSMQNWKDNSLYAFKNQIYMSGEIEYMQGQNVLRELFDKGMDQWKKGEYANGMANMLVGMMQITGRVLSSLDQGAIAMMESQNIPRYALDAMASNKKIPKDKRKEIANIALYGRSRMRQDLIESGMSPERAGVLADLQMRSELMASLSEYGISKTEVLDASLNDALQSVGRNRVITTEGFKQARDNLRDAGITSGLAIGFLENLASSANRGGQAQQIFARMLYGFALVPARVFSTALWFSPVGFIRLGVDSLLKKSGIESRYATSLATDLQYKQRVYESIAGTVLLGALASLVKSSTDDEDDELPFKIVATGNGPNYTTDPQYYDSWHKRNKPGELSMYFGKTKFTLNIGRGGEAVAIPFMIAGAFDDWNIKSKQNAAKNSPKDLEMAAEVLGSAFYAYAQRGPWAAFGRPLFDAKKQDKLIPDLFGKAAYLGKTFVPILGSSLSRNISDFINDPIDKSSVQGAIYANTPVIGPMFGTKALNALGQPIRGDDWNDRLFKIGVPLVFSFPKNTPENDLNILILKKGDGPAIPTRTNAQKKFGDVITDKEFEIYVREYGRVVSDKMFKNRKRLETMESKNYIKELDKYVNGYSIDGIKVSGASDMAVRAVKRSRNQ